MMEQYRNIKKEYADCILFFRLGDFYEMFFSDAEVASRELDIVLTSRDGGGIKVPMCGVPHHAYANYVGKLLEKGYRVAICEQVEDTRQAKGLVDREVIRVITPGTAMEEAWISEDNNYLAAIVMNGDKSGLAFLDILTGDFQACQLEGERVRNELRDELARLNPTECLIPRWVMDAYAEVLDENLSHTLLTEVDPEYFTLSGAMERIEKYYQGSSLTTELRSNPEAATASGALLAFVESTQKLTLSHLRPITLYQPASYLGMDRNSRLNLELVANLRDGSRQGSLIGELDFTRTSMGRRLLRVWIEHPLLDTKLIERRLGAVEELLDNRTVREDLSAELAKVRDIERIAGKIGVGLVNPRELLALKSCLESVPELKHQGISLTSPLVRDLLDMNEVPSARDLIAAAIDDSAPALMKDGGVIKPGFNLGIDELRRIAFESDQWLVDYEQKERVRSGIKSLKIGYNRVFGYYLEVTRSNAGQVPADYTRKQTLVNAERFITEELKLFENEILGARERLMAMEQEVYLEIRTSLKEDIEAIQGLAGKLAGLDALISLAQAAFANRYTRPGIKPRGAIVIKGGRHPVVEKMLTDYRFVPNDCLLDPSGRRLGIVTGPNMGGKSTYLRQVALIVIMAQMGSFVPADEADIGIVDQVFTRIGASDDLSSGKSTFMVEMVEVANIVRHSTSRSLLILDEIGRGTSTYDGMSIARALAEYLASNEGVRALFATHYHELTDLADKFDSVFNLCVSVKESGEEVIFLRRVIPGKADKSYGIHVAKLAGIPREITRRAEIILEGLEDQSINPVNVTVQPSLFEEEHPVVDAVRAADVNRLTPLEALNLINEWKNILAR